MVGLNKRRSPAGNSRAFLLERMLIMYVFPGQFVFLTDQYYSDFSDKNISLGHNPSGSNEKSGRPCFFAFPDPSDPKISWVVPVSSQYQKYEAIVNQKIRKRGFCNTIILGELNGHSTAFLIQNMCPVTENYIASVYLHHGTTPVQIDQRTSWRIMRDAKRILEKTKAGVPNLLYADVRSIYAELTCQLHFDAPAQVPLRQEQKHEEQSNADKPLPRMADQLAAAQAQAAASKEPSGPLNHDRFQPSL